jgi:hypothetical protein
MSEAPGLADTLAMVFVDEGWSVERQRQLGARDLSFDAAAENNTAIVFIKELEFERLANEWKVWAAEVAAVLQRRSIGVKAWEGYLLLLCAGEANAYEDIIQDVQHDLSYCRKLVLASSDLERTPDLYASLRNKVAFLFPLAPSERGDVGDVRQALVTKLVAFGIAPEVATDLVAKFDEVTCQCYDRLKAFSSVEVEGESG